MAEITGIKSVNHTTQQNTKKAELEKKKDDFNSAFTENGNIKVEITSRGPGEPAGLSYDFYYGNENTKGLKAYYEEGIFEDITKDKNGNDKFTNQDKRNLVSKFQEIHAQKGLKNNFSKMYIGETFDYTKDEYLALAEAAGYKLKEGVNTQKTPINTPTETTVEINQEIDTQEITLTEHKAKKPVSEPSVLNASLQPHKSIKIPALKEKVTIPNDYTTSTEEQIVEFLNTNPDLENKNSQEKSEFLTDTIATLIQEKNELSQPRKTVKGKKILLWKMKDKTVEWTQEEKNANATKIQEINTKIDKAKFYKAYVDKVENTNFWGGNMNTKISCDENGNTTEVHPKYTKVVVTDDYGNELKAARLDVYDWSTNTEKSIYHPITIRKVINQSANSQKAYYDVVADISTELKNIKEKY